MVSKDSLDLNVLGLNSGTSIDGIDVVLCNFRQESPESSLHLKIVHHGEMPMPADLKETVLRLIKDNSTSVEEISEVNTRLGMAFAEAAVNFCVEYKVDRVDLIGSHGQTIWYVSDPKPGQCRSVLTFAEATYIANKMGKTVVSDFRISEQSVGRQGAPMIAFFDSLLLIHPTKLRACQNIGGISNVCFVVPESKGGLDRCFDYDIGPGNVFIDAAIRFFTGGKSEYDKDGEWGRHGTVDQEIVDTYLDQYYFNRTPPKTTGRELFGDSEAERLIGMCQAKGLNNFDIVATLTRITAQSIVNDYRRYAPGPIDEIILCGGGSFNPNITEFIQQNFPQSRMYLLDEHGVSSGAKEAVTFAFQGLEAILGRPLIVPDQVETSTPVVVGKITPGANYRELQRTAVNFSRGHEEEPYLPAVRRLVLD
ncbi:unnamed protein product [Kuraishia capsulata CBS 1993]|uniref:Anhydro-N-acetylmuramic acid kinase n=1 Tax=Kuraishia capsulata CBS 1993 TaxID=1382522 RepID=W6MJ96_9ASCO|nr:uncharacterized protein KUCA_T00002302001 [Kuraishia capsulata CBS 1993]CDK26331.1 unnamed protein product [Kuraishia capsulata CBS 1993]